MTFRVMLRFCGLLMCSLPLTGQGVGSWCCEITIALSQHHPGTVTVAVAVKNLVNIPVTFFDGSAETDLRVRLTSKDGKEVPGPTTARGCSSASAGGGA